MVSQKVTIKNPTGLHLETGGNTMQGSYAVQISYHLYISGQYSQCQECAERVGRLRKMWG